MTKIKKVASFAIITAPFIALLCNIFAVYYLNIFSTRGRVLARVYYNLHVYISERSRDPSDHPFPLPFVTIRP